MTTQSDSPHQFPFLAGPPREEVGMTQRELAHALARYRDGLGFIEVGAVETVTSVLVVLTSSRRRTPGELPAWHRERAAGTAAYSAVDGSASGVNGGSRYAWRSPPCNLGSSSLPPSRPK